MTEKTTTLTAGDPLAPSTQPARVEPQPEPDPEPKAKRPSRVLRFLEIGPEGQAKKARRLGKLAAVKERQADWQEQRSDVMARKVMRGGRRARKAQMRADAMRREAARLRDR
jgi:hypothetical protein